jgi:hypothetical protein
MVRAAFAGDDVPDILRSSPLRLPPVMFRKDRQPDCFFQRVPIRAKWMETNETAM